MGLWPDDFIANGRARASQAKAFARRALFKTSQRLSTLAMLGLAAALLIPLPTIHNVYDKLAGERAKGVSAPVVLSSPQPEPVAGREVRRLAMQSARELPMTLADAGRISRHSRSAKSAARRRAAAMPITVARKLSPRLARLASKAPTTLIKARDVEALPPDGNAPTERLPVAANGAPKPSRSPAEKGRPTGAAKVAVAESAAEAAAAKPELDVSDSATIARERSQCGKILAKANVVVSEAEPMKQGACGSAAPVRVESAGTPPVALKPASTMNCPMAAALSAWLTKEVQPAAQKVYGAPVTRLLSVASYSCRNRYGRADAPLSEHAFANAIDLAGFVLADGTIVKVVSGWGPTVRDARPETIKVTVAKLDVTMKKAGAPPSKLGADTIKPPASALESEPRRKAGATSRDDTTADEMSAQSRHAKFLRTVHQGACGIFGTVLGPEANDAHRDHLHLDMKQRRRRAYCE